MAYTDEHQQAPEPPAAEGTAEQRYNTKLQEEITRMQAYKKSLEEEFANANPDDPETHKKVRSKLHELVPNACETVAWLLDHSSSESVRGNMAKFVLTESMKSADGEKTKDVIGDMFKKLQDNDVNNDNADELDTADEHS